MKIKAKQYARALHESLKGRQEEQEIRAVIQRFAGQLARHNDLRKAEEVIREYEKLVEAEQGLVRAEVVAADKPDKAILDKIRQYIIEATGANQVEIKDRQDKSLLGGAVIKYGDKVLDASLKSGLEDLRRRMKK